ncbi:MAG: polysaccharide deacetylase [Lachnospiraceae bacterium]|nr:polysaccharide deacetylase [Lachnospiraceae bacterium]MDD6193190.1 polysaccharide deacetylase [Lachnospiraceae bacterium]MDY4794259.1 polysaccharide deacetylase family protein [Pararoseburia sp.]
MDEKEQEALKKQRERRKRVQRIRTGIITFISVWMILSIVLTVIMCVKIISLQKQIDVLVGNYDQNKKVENTEAGVQNDDFTVVNSVTDSKDNLAEEGDIHKVYLTFDDGPSENTDKILDILDDYGIKATFFVNGREDEESLAAYKRIVDEGHTIAMHSYSHKYSEIYSSLDAFKKDYEKIQNLIYDTTGVESMYYRFPGGSSNRVSNAHMSDYIKFLNEQGIVYFDWNVSSGDATSQAFTADELVENVMSDVVKYKTSVVLMHDAKTKSTTVQALPEIIEALQKSGALILPIDENTDVIQHTSIQQ